MSSSYEPGYWAGRFRHMAGAERQAVIERTNKVFAERTGVFRKLDPKQDRKLCDQWLFIRDDVMAGRVPVSAASDQEEGLSLRSALIAAHPENLLRMIGEAYEDMQAPWLNVAREEEKKKIVEIPGLKHHPRIMEYIRTCDNLYATENKAAYTEREGEEGVKWCSAFVNWCMSQVGIRGTGNARALSWLEWGKPLAEPQVGAVIVMKTSKWRHVALYDVVKGKPKMLGGNQMQAPGSKSSDSVSYLPHNPAIVLGYRWPA